MAAIAWAIVFAAWEIGGVLDQTENPPGWETVAGVISLAILSMVAICTALGW